MFRSFLLDYFSNTMNSLDILIWDVQDLHGVTGGTNAYQWLPSYNGYIISGLILSLFYVCVTLH